MKRIERVSSSRKSHDSLRVSKRALHVLETDKVYPKWAEQPKIAAFLGYDPFTDPALSGPPSNKPVGIAMQFYHRIRPFPVFI